VRVLCAAVGGSLAHGIRVREFLAASGINAADVGFVGESGQHKLFCEGQESRLYLSPFGPTNWFSVALGSSSYRHLRRLRSETMEATERDRQIIRDFRPDLIIQDTRWPMAVAARLEDVPQIGICTGLHLSPAVGRVPPSAIRQYQDLDRFFDALLRPLLGRQAKFWDSHYAVAADLPILFGYEDAFPTELSWDPLISSGGGDQPEWPGARRMRVYVGGGGRDDGESPLQAGATALAARGFSVIASRGERREESGFISVPFVAESALIPTADVVVSHGGAGMIYQGMLAGKPQVLLPHNVEQQVYTELAVRLGVAVRAASVDEILPVTQLLLAEYGRFALAATEVRDACLRSLSSESRLLYSRAILDRVPGHGAGYV
jgi:hypothetical protein